MNDRIVKYMEKPGGGRNLGLIVNGVHILIEATRDNQEMADHLAVIISELGPAKMSKPKLAIVEDKHGDVSASKRGKKFHVGEKVWCNVRGSSGWCTVTEVGTGYRSGQIKISGFKLWCPGYNFDHRTE